MSELQNPDSRAWDSLSLGAISLCLILLIIQWRQLPFFLDMYYHLAIAKGFEVAGGIVGHNFWEYGPQGAPHLYPPLLHLLMLAFLKTGLDEITTLRLFSLLIPGLLLLVLWHVIKNILNRKTAFFAVFLSLSPSIFIISASFTPAATLGMILLLLGLYSIYRNRILSAILMLGMIFYVHIGIAVISLIYLILAKLIGVIKTKKLLTISSFSLLIGFPWVFHIIQNLPYIRYQVTATMPIRLYPVISIFFIIGLCASLKRIKEYKIFLALLLSLIPMALLYPFRFFCAQGLAGFLLFSGVGLEKSYSAIDGNLKRNRTGKKYGLFFLVILLLYLLFFAPSIHIHRNRINVDLSDSLLTSVFEGKERRSEEVLSTGIFSPRFFNLLTDYLKRYSNHGEFIWSNYRYIAGILWAMAERPSLSSMLGEIQRKETDANIRNAALLIIIDEPKGQFRNIYGRAGLNLARYFRTVGVEKEEDTYIYILINRNPSMVAGRKVPKPLISTCLAYILLAIYIFAVIIKK